MAVYDDVVNVLAATTGMPEARLSPESRLDELGLDSLARLEVGLALQLDDAVVARAETVNDLVELRRA